MFVAMVDRTLLCRTAKSLEEFNVLFFYGKQANWASHVDIWVEFGLKLKCKIMHIDIASNHLLPEPLYSNSVLTELGLQFCIVTPSRRVDWKSLPKLRIEFVKLNQHVVENILLGCPALCNLGLYSCWGFNSLKIDSPALRKLSVQEMNDEYYERLEISAPYLSILEITNPPNGRKFWIKNTSAVVEVKVGIAGVSDANGLPADVINAVKVLFEDIRHVKKLHMKTGFFKFVSKMVADGCQLQQQSRRLCLIIDNLYGCHIRSGALSLLESCPNLETLQLHEDTRNPFRRHQLSMSDDLNCDLLRLKMVSVKITVTIDEVSVESCGMLMLVRILLKRAVALEKMEIRFEMKNGDVKIEDREKFGNVFQELMSWPKSSSQALLIISLIPRTNYSRYELLLDYFIHSVYLNWS